MADTPAGGRLIAVNYTPRIRAERLIAIGRVVLALLSLLAVSLDPSVPSPQHATATDLVLGTFVAYAVALAALTWIAQAYRPRLTLLSHGCDLLVFSLLTYLTEGTTSPFFIFFVFSTVAGTLRWRWRGALWTAAAALVAFNAIGVYGDVVMHDPAFALQRFAIRSLYLAMLGGLLVYVGIYEERHRREMSKLAAWPHVLPRSSDPPLREVLTRVARILDTPRALMVWQEPEEPWLYIASWTKSEILTSRESPETFHPLLAPPLAELTFLSADIRAPRPVVLHQAPPPDGLREWLGTPIHSALRDRFTIEAVLSMPLRGECLVGRLFALDKANMTGDDLLLGQLVARQVAASMDQYLLARRLRQAAAAEERIRLSRDLHDGVLQSLTGAALQLETVQRLWDADPVSARGRLAAIQRLIADEQRDLRFYIRDSKLDAIALSGGDAGLHRSLREVARRVEALWGLRVELQLECPDNHSPNSLISDICRIVHETMVNAARHAAASAVRVVVAAENGDVRIAVSDNGHGFPFQGEYDHAALSRKRLGPVMLKERVESLRGTLAIRSSPTGSRLDIRLPRQRRSA